MFEDRARPYTGGVGTSTSTSTGAMNRERQDAMLKPLDPPQKVSCIGRELQRGLQNAVELNAIIDSLELRLGNVLVAEPPNTSKAGIGEPIAPTDVSRAMQENNHGVEVAMLRLGSILERLDL